MITQEHEIMLVEKKIHLAPVEIHFLGMHFSNGAYQLRPHISEEFLTFPNVAKHTSQLSKLLNNNPPLGTRSNNSC